MIEDAKPAIVNGGEKMTYNESYPKLPPNFNFETVAILNASIKATRSLGQLKGEAKTIPNERILIDTLGLQEAKDSSAVENIITTHDELFRAGVDSSYKNIAAKEVQNYALALSHGFNIVRNKGILTVNDIIKIQELTAPNKPLRKIPGTILKNEATGETVYTPPQDHNEIIALLRNFEKYFNDDNLHNIDPIIKVPILHLQFESIHPFYDGNGRTGRILNILYLVQKQLLDIPVLYLSNYIIKNKNDYYRLLQSVRTDGKWEEWILWMLNGIHITANETLQTIRGIKELMTQYKHAIREQFKFYSHDLINNLFKHPYTKIEFLAKDLNIHHNTATLYLNQLIKINLLKKIKLGRSNYYLNESLYKLLKGDNI